MDEIEIGPPETARLLAEGREDFVLLDCRTAPELAIARIEGALHIPMKEIPGRLDELDPEHEIVVMCHHGVRSRMVVGFMRQQGYARCRSMAGGIDLWSQIVDSSVPAY